MQSHCVRKKETACVEQESVVSKVHAWRLRAREGGARGKLRKAKGKFIVRNEISTASVRERPDYSLRRVMYENTLKLLIK